MQENQWIGISYLIPANPSKGRVFIWRKLKALGAEIIKPGLAVLPNNSANIRKLNDLKLKIDSFKGQSSLIEFDFYDDGENKLLHKKFALSDENKYETIVEQCENIIDLIKSEKDEEKRQELENKLLSKIKNLDRNSLSLSSQAKKDLEEAAGEIISTLKTIPSEFMSALKK